MGLASRIWEKLIHLLQRHWGNSEFKKLNRYLHLVACCSSRLLIPFLFLDFVVQSLNLASLFATPWTAARQSSLSFTISWSLLKLMPIELLMPSNHLILFGPLLFLPSVFPSIRVFSNESREKKRRGKEKPTVLFSWAPKSLWVDPPKLSCILFLIFTYLFIHLSALGSRLWHTGSLLCHEGSSVAVTNCLVVARGLSCSTTRGVLIPSPAIGPVTPALQGEFLATGAPGKSLFLYFCVHAQWLRRVWLFATPGL